MKVIAAVSGKGGTGKTTFTTNIANIVSQKGHKTCIIDLDFDLGQIDLLLDIESYIEYDISHILRNEQTTLNSIVQFKDNSNLYLLSSPKSFKEKIHNVDAYKQIIKDLSNNNFEYVFIDTPAGIDSNNPLFDIINIIDLVSVITNPDKISLRDADNIIGILESNGINKNNITLVINKYRRTHFSSKTKIKAKDIERMLDIQLLATIKESHKYQKSVNNLILPTTRFLDIKNEYNTVYKKITTLY